MENKDGLSGMEKDDSLITGASVTPEPDEGCVNTCYYVGWSWDHDHTPVLEQT